MGKKKLLIAVPATQEQKKTIEEVASSYEVVTLESIGENVSDVEIMYGWEQIVGDRILQDKASGLKWLQSESAGIDNLDLALIKEKNIILTNASGIHGHQMSETILGMLFIYTRKLKESIQFQETNTWQVPSGLTDLNGKSVLILGTGQVGTRLAKLLQALELTVYGVNRNGREVDYFDQTYTQNDFEQHLDKMDIVINLLPETPATHHLFDRRLFNKMKDQVMFVNAGRGGAVKTEDLIEACKEGGIAFAGLDVFEEEPLPSTSPLWDVDNIFITPHTSGKSDNYYKRLFPIFMENLESYLTTQEVVINKIGE